MQIIIQENEKTQSIDTESNNLNKVEDINKNKLLL